MTICASVKVRDGMALATDSMSQIQGLIGDTGQTTVVKTYSNARKLFQVGDRPIGVMSYGVGNIGIRSIQGLMREFSVSKATRNVETITKTLASFFREAYDEEYSASPKDEQPTLGFFIAGYSPGSPFAQEWEVVFPRDDAPKRVRADDAFGSSWRGISMPFSRLYMGFDPRIGQALAAVGLSNNDIHRVRQVLNQFKSQVVYDGMPIQDAVNFAAYIVRTTVGLATFEVGPPSCGGPLQVATILPDTGFEWVRQPTLSVEDV